ncbi:MAG: dihydropteroate synthase [Syntrophobacteraceae bacterium]|jgi:5-methyltetrahydrofolate--homocysteine methyltransferase
MLIIGEKINGTRKKVGEAVINRAAGFIRDLALSQVQAGAELLDVNAGTPPDRELDDLVWLVRTVQEAVDVPLCLDSPSFDALAAAVTEVNHVPMINSINGDCEKLANILPLVSKNGCTVIALALDETGMPKGVQDRMTVIRRVFEATRAAGIQDEKVYVDPLIMTIATDIRAGLTVLETMRTVHAEFPDAHITGGFSNISFGLPGRAIINRTFLTLVLEAGMDSAIIDPTDNDFHEALLTTEMLLGRDRFCRAYTQAHRSGRIGKKILP